MTCIERLSAVTHGDFRLIFLPLHHIIKIAFISRLSKIGLYDK